MYIKGINAGNVAPFHDLDQDLIDACRDYSTVELRIILGQEQYHATPEQIESGLTDAHVGVRAVYSERIDFTPTPEQIERGLTDASQEVREIWIGRVIELSSALLEAEFMSDFDEQSSI
jgi:hypothetical protein